jgi:hypothetical protein
MLRDGEAADPPAFLTDQPVWKPGYVFVAANGRTFRIVDTNAEVEVAGLVLFDRSGRWNRSRSQGRNLSAKGVTNADVRTGSGPRYMALVPELFQLSLPAREKQNNSPSRGSVQAVQGEASSRQLYDLIR